MNDLDVGWCIRCMTWVDCTEFGTCCVCGAATRGDAPPAPVTDPPVSIVIPDPDDEMRHHGELA